MIRNVGYLPDKRKLKVHILDWNKKHPEATFDEKAYSPEKLGCAYAWKPSRPRFGRHQKRVENV